MNRNQTIHEQLIPLLVKAVGAKSYLELHTIRCPGVAMFNVTTAEFIAKNAPVLGPFDFCFIDADHSRQAVRRDFYGILPHISDEGLICLHDTNPATKADTDPGLCGDASTQTPPRRQIPTPACAEMPGGLLV
jgi:hypothetical protein